MWTDHFIKYLDGTESLILDGLSRRVEEAPVLDSALKFYKRPTPFVVSIEVSREWARQRLLERRRGDDNEAEIERRLAWYDSSVLQTLEFFKKTPGYEFIRINGEQSVEKVHEDILSLTHV